MFLLRIIAKLGLKFALPLLFFQVVFLAPLPDVFGCNYDLASLTKPVTANLAKCAISRPPLDNAPAARERLDRLHVILCLIPSTEHKKQKLRQKKTPTSEGGDDPFAGPASVPPIAQEWFHNSSPLSTKIFICSHNKKTPQSGFTGEKPFRGQHCCSRGCSRLTLRNRPETTISVGVPAFKATLRASPPALLAHSFHRFDQ